MPAMSMTFSRAACDNAMSIVISVPVLPTPALYRKHSVTTLTQTPNLSYSIEFVLFTLA